jgi:dipeptidyl aminopeptidase/acylaminoacyl peptidase
VSWRAPDGLEIEGILCLPEGDGPFALVVNIHGGPVWSFSDSWSMHYAWVPLLVARGYAVLNPNPRGSSGRGQEFARRVVHDMGGADTHDYLSGVDELVRRGIADPDRIGLIGRSYGGFMSSWLVTQSDRFAAAIPLSPVTDWYSQGFTSNIAGWGNNFLGADPERQGNAVHERSPVLRASRVSTPCLNVAGALDRCTPPGQAEEFHRALLAHGVESALVIYPGEGHGVFAYPTLIDFLTRVASWFGRFMPPRSRVDGGGEW